MKPRLHGAFLYTVEEVRALVERARAAVGGLQPHGAALMVEGEVKREAVGFWAEVIGGGA